MIDNYPDWKSLPGLILDGGYELKDIIEAEEERAVIRVRVLGAYKLKAYASFYMAEPVEVQKQAEIWESLRAFDQKANLCMPLGAGTLTVNNCSIAYLVLPNPDEHLDEILEQRALRPEEATEAIRCVARALEQLHSHGLVHGCVSPSEILAFDDSIKLSAQSVREVNQEPVVDSRIAKYLAPESDGRNLTIASDTWCVGASLYEMLTQKQYVPGAYEEAIALKHPFGTIAERCLESDPDERCKIAELESILRSKAPLTKPKQVFTSPAPSMIQSVATSDAATEIAKNSSRTFEAEASTFSNQVRAFPADSTSADLPDAREPQRSENRTVAADPVGETSQIYAEQGPRKVSAPLSNSSLARQGEPRVEERPGPLTGRKGLLYAVGAFILIFLVLWMVRVKRPSTPNSKSGASHNIAGAVANEPKPAWPTKTLSPDTQQSKTNAPPTLNQGSTSPTQVGQKTIWRVILYTYDRQQDAEKKAYELAVKRPDLQTQVFSPADSGGPYLVIAGGKLNHDEAARMRRRALREGMPRDSYIQNYSR